MILPLYVFAPVVKVVTPYKLLNSWQAVMGLLIGVSTLASRVMNEFVTKLHMTCPSFYGVRAVDYNFGNTLEKVAG